tara:strand:+ start:318 stop:800 length:483 start_codon:yes stop_codon:yes gene_type:complete
MASSTVYQRLADKNINWDQRADIKNQLIKSCLKTLLYCVLGSLAFFTLPAFIINIELGKAFLLALFPMLFMCLSWIIPVWKFFDRKAFLLPLTIGAMPMRIGVCLGFIVLVKRYSPEVDIAALVLAMMSYWLLFSIPELIMISNFTKTLDFTSQDEPISL